MQRRVMTILLAAILTGCAGGPSDRLAGQPPEKSRVPTQSRATTAPASPVSSAGTLDAYKRDIALRISEFSTSKVYTGRPQALLRSVVVVRYTVDERGQLIRSEIMRSNRDRETETTALATLRNAAPFPRPASHLLRNGRLDVSETWLFNNDGRFQLRTIAQPQMDQ